MRDGRHAAVDGIETVAAADEVGGGFGGAADARELDQVLRLKVNRPGRFDYGGGDGIVAATGAERRQGAFVVAAREADCVPRQRRVRYFGFCQESHWLLR